MRTDVEVGLNGDTALTFDKLDSADYDVVLDPLPLVRRFTVHLSPLEKRELLEQLVADTHSEEGR